MSRATSKKFFYFRNSDALRDVCHLNDMMVTIAVQVDLLD